MLDPMSIGKPTYERGGHHCHGRSPTRIYTVRNHFLFPYLLETHCIREHLAIHMY